MGILSDRQIDSIPGIITPFQKELTRKGQISWGLSSFGYDIRLGYKFRVFTNSCAVGVAPTEIDPKNFNEKSFLDFDLTPDADGIAPQNFVRIPPNSFALAESLETFNVPRDLTGILLDKSSYRRCGILVGGTVLEAGWRGRLTIEISNTTPLPARVYAGEGIAQLLLFRSDEKNEVLAKHFAQNIEEMDEYEKFSTEWESASCSVSYADRKNGGKYQDQTGLTLPFVEK